MNHYQREMAWEFIVLLVLGIWAAFQFCTGCSEHFVAAREDAQGGQGGEGSTDGPGASLGGSGAEEGTGGAPSPETGGSGPVEGTGGGEPLPSYACHYPSPEECGNSACQVEMHCYSKPLPAYCTEGTGHFYGACTAGDCQILGVCDE